MKCPECRGDAFTKGLFELADIFKDEPIVIRNVPGSCCEQCGYMLISADVAKRVSQALAGEKSRVRAFALVYDLAKYDIGQMVADNPGDSKTPHLMGEQADSRLALMPAPASNQKIA